jgi:mevalonate kinase
MSNNTNSEKESLSRIREILFGDQIASLENKVDQLAEKQKEDIEKLMQELNTVVEDAESLINDKTEALKEELMRNIKAVETAGVMKKELADILRNIAELLDQDSQE